MTEPTRQQILDAIARFIREIIGEDWVADFEIRMETSFADDLELESIEFVALAEKLKVEYGTMVDFAGWLATMQLPEILALRVGQLVEYIAECSSRQTTV